MIIALQGDGKFIKVSNEYCANYSLQMKSLIPVANVPEEKNVERLGIQSSLVMDFDFA